MRNACDTPRLKFNRQEDDGDGRRPGQMKQWSEDKWERDILDAAQKKTPAEIRIGCDILAKEHLVYVNDTSVHLATGRDDSVKWTYKIAQFLRLHHRLTFHPRPSWCLGLKHCRANIKIPWSSSSKNHRSKGRASHDGLD